MRKALAVLIGVVGLWFLLPGFLSVVGSFSVDAGGPVAPAMSTGTFLGATFFVGAMLLWRSGARRGTGRNTAASDERLQAGTRVAIAQGSGVTAAAPPYQRPPTLPDLEAEVHYLPTSEGGRSSPVASGYRPIHDFGIPGELNVGHHEYPGRDWVQPGEAVTTLLWLLAPELQKQRLHVGFEFKVQEGRRVVGIGMVTNVLNPVLRRES